MKAFTLGFLLVALCLWGVHKFVQSTVAKALELQRCDAPAHIGLLYVEQVSLLAGVRV